MDRERRGSPQAQRGVRIVKTRGKVAFLTFEPCQRRWWSGYPDEYHLNRSWDDLDETFLMNWERVAAAVIERDRGPREEGIT